MGIYSENACKNFYQGYNCAQAVLLAFSGITGLDKETSLKLASSFGGGMGRLREVCGAVSMMFLIAGILNGYTEPNNDSVKAEHYKLIQDLAQEFKSRHGTIICRELLGLESGADSPIPSKRTEQYYKERPCGAFIKTASEIIENKLLSGNKNLTFEINNNLQS